MEDSTCFDDLVVDPHSDEESRLDELVADYYQWLSGNGGRDPKDVFPDLPKGLQQRFVREIDRLNLLWSITAPVRQALAASADVEGHGARSVS